MTLATAAGPLMGNHDALWLDLDGVVYRSHDPVPHAVKSISAVHTQGTAVAFLTNNASRPPATISAHLRELGLEFVSDEDVVTSAQAIAQVMGRELPSGARVLVVGGEGLRQALSVQGLVPVASLHDKPQALVQGFAPDLGWADLAEASYAIAAGLPWFVSNTDLTVPTARGTAPGNGALVHAVKTATGAEPTVGGKPFAPLFDTTRERLGSANPLMVGDRIDTDIVGARRSGIASLHVLTGVDDVNVLADLAEANRPDFVAPDLRALSQPHRKVLVDGDEAACGQARATRLGGVIGATGGTELDRVRAAVELSWHGGGRIEL